MLQDLTKTALGRAVLESLFGGKLDLDDFESLAPSRQFLKEIKEAKDMSFFRGDPALFIGREKRITKEGAKAERASAARRLQAFKSRRLSALLKAAMEKQGPPKRVKAENVAQVLNQEGAPQFLLAAVAANEVAENPQEVTIKEQGTVRNYTADTIIGEWTQLNLSKEQALVVQRIRVGCIHNSLTDHILIGIRWGRPGGALTQGHLSSGKTFEIADQIAPQQWMFTHCDYVFAWALHYAAAVDSTFQEIDLKPNFAVCRSYTVYVYTETGDTLSWNVRLYSQTVGISYPGILAVSR